MNLPDSDRPSARSRWPYLAALGLTRRVLWVWAVVALIVVPILALVAGAYFGRPGSSGAPAPAARPAVGGPFALVDGEGRAVTDADFRGRLMLVFFGFTHCPDICPTALGQIAQALDRLGADSGQVAAIFITVDPERDTPAKIKEYVGHFHPRLVGLTGTPEQIAAAARAYRVYFAKARSPGMAADEYTIDHTTIVYLMGRDGKFLAHFSHGTEPDTLVQRLKAFF